MVPSAWTLRLVFSLGGDYGTTATNLIVGGAPTLTEIPCNTDGADKLTPKAVPRPFALPNGLSYSRGTAKYTFNFNMRSKVAQGKCYRLRLLSAFCPRDGVHDVFIRGGR